MDSASYHYQLNTEYYPKGKTPTNAPKGLNAHVLRNSGCSQISVKREDGSAMNYEVPETEPPDWTVHRKEKPGAKAPTTGESGTVYARRKKDGSGLAAAELGDATRKWLKAHRSEALDSKVERIFRERDWKIIWTPPYCPKFQPIELV